MEHDSGVIQRKYIHQFMEVLLSIHASLFRGNNLVKKLNSFFKAHSEHMIQSSVFKALSSKLCLQRLTLPPTCSFGTVSGRRRTPTMDADAEPHCARATCARATTSSFG